MTGLAIEQQPRVWWLTLNRPEKLNALNDDIRNSLDSAIDELRTNPEVSVVVLRGAGRSFSAGADIDGWGTGPKNDWVHRHHRNGAWQRTLDAFEALPQVTVGSLHGHCIGGGALLAAACDLRVGDGTLRVRIPELALGIPLTWAGVPRLAREIGLPLTRDLVMTARELDASAALASGFLQRIAPAGSLSDATAQVVEELLAMPPGPLVLTKALTSALGRSQTLVAGWADADVLAWSLREDESRTAAAAYIRSRRPAGDHES